MSGCECIEHNNKSVMSVAVLRVPLPSFLMILEYKWKLVGFCYFPLYKYGTIKLLSTSNVYICTGEGENEVGCDINAIIALCLFNFFTWFYAFITQIRCKEPASA